MQALFGAGERTTTALNDIGFSTHRREFLCVVGPSGCGKSTLVRILAGLEEKTSGQVLLQGAPVDGPGPDRGMVFQNYTLFPWLTVKKSSVMFGPEVNGRMASTKRKIVPCNGCNWSAWKNSPKTLIRISCPAA